jgi:hypothetical protein
VVFVGVHLSLLENVRVFRTCDVEVSKCVGFEKQMLICAVRGAQQG